MYCVLYCVLLCRCTVYLHRGLDLALSQRKVHGREHRRIHFLLQGEKELVVASTLLWREEGSGDGRTTRSFPCFSTGEREREIDCQPFPQAQEPCNCAPHVKSTSGERERERKRERKRKRERETRDKREKIIVSPCARTRAGSLTRLRLGHAHSADRRVREDHGGDVAGEEREAKYWQNTGKATR